MKKFLNKVSNLTEGNRYFRILIGMIVTSIFFILSYVIPIKENGIELFHWVGVILSLGVFIGYFIIVYQDIWNE